MTLDTIPVPRHRVFVLLNGAFVVQWEENRIQDLMTGKYYAYNGEDYGSAIRDYELAQLKAAGCVVEYDAGLVYLSPSPTLPKERGRSFYLHTLQPKQELQRIVRLLREAGLLDRYAVLVREDHVVIRGKDGIAFSDFDEAERARQLLVKRIGEAMMGLAVAFVEVNAEI
ncbi:MAG: hypothetical protein NZ750_03340 [Anaerolineae bacterium]|nr:hypothetical protein [Anaerolineae bacterium]MDW8171354.1 hypothetical protein [Anaerolineae bacterium]